MLCALGAWADGRRLSRDEALAEALSFRVEAAVRERRHAQRRPAPHGLSARELEVLRLLVAGKSDREIADALFISPRTASKHVGAILAKLDVASRAEAAVLALQRSLV